MTVRLLAKKIASREFAQPLKFVNVIFAKSTILDWTVGLRVFVPGIVFFETFKLS